MIGMDTAYINFTADRIKAPLNTVVILKRWVNEGKIWITYIYSDSKIIRKFNERFARFL